MTTTNWGVWGRAFDRERRIREAADARLAREIDAEQRQLDYEARQAERDRRASARCRRCGHLTMHWAGCPLEGADDRAVMGAEYRVPA